MRGSVRRCRSGEPSAAIGGDYFDILDAGDGKVAVVVADVAGHGLAAGLRMALVKSALTLLVEDRIAAPAILARLHRLLRSKPGERSFVTASLSIFDPANGALEPIRRELQAAYDRIGPGDIGVFQLAMMNGTKVKK